MYGHRAIGPSPVSHLTFLCATFLQNSSFFKAYLYIFLKRQNVTNRNFKIHLFNTSRIAPFLQTASSTRLILVKIQNETICLYRHGQPNPD